MPKRYPSKKGKVDREGQSEGTLPSLTSLLMKAFGGPKISQWEGVIQKGSREG
jgi:hypothetical protein